MANIACRIRKYRKSAHLSQRELAGLVGLRSQGVVSDIEAGAKHTSLRAALAYAVVFDVPLKELFPALHAKIEAEVAAQAQRLSARLSHSRRRAATAMHLSALMARLSDLS